MRKLIASTFTSLDSVMRAPVGPTEDPTGNFTLGGWLFTFGDSGMDFSAAGFDGKDRDLVLGRKKACGVPYVKVISMEQFVATRQRYRFNHNCTQGHAHYGSWPRKFQKLVL